MTSCRVSSQNIVNLANAKATLSTLLLKFLILLLWKQEKYQINITVDRIAEDLKEANGGLYFLKIT